MKYSGKKLEKLSFPLGGIGTGSIGLCGNGRLEDFEIFGRPSKGSLNGYTHIAVKAAQNGKSSALVLQGDRTDELIGRYGKNFGYGPDKYTMAGFPHFESLEFDGRFPIAELEFADRGFPGRREISETTRARILEAAGRYGYRAAPLAPDEIRTIGVIVFNLKNEYFNRLITELEAELRRRAQSHA